MTATSMVVEPLGSAVAVAVTLPVIVILYRIRARLAGEPYPKPRWVCRARLTWWRWRAERRYRAA